MTPPASQGFGYPGSMRGVWHHQDRRRRAPRELTGIVDHSWEGSSRGLLEWTLCRAGLAPCTRTVGRARKRPARGGANRDAGSPSRDSKNAIALACSKDATSVHDACHIVTQAGDAPGEVRRRVQQDTTGHRGRTGDPLYQIRLLLRASHTQAHPAPTRTTPRSLHGR